MILKGIKLFWWPSTLSEAEKIYIAKIVCLDQNGSNFSSYLKTGLANWNFNVIF